MNEKEIIQKLTEIKEIARMKREEVYEKNPELKYYLHEEDSVYPAKVGWMAAELEILIKRIELYGLK